VLLIYWAALGANAVGLRYYLLGHLQSAMAVLHSLWGLAVKIVRSAADVFVPECGVLVTWVHLLVHFAKFGWLFANPCSSSFVVI
jgi:hypothetical protein